MRLLLGKGSRRPPGPGRGPVRRAGADPPRQSGSAGAPRAHTQAPLPQGPDAVRKLQTRRGRQRYALRMETVEPVFGQIKAGRGFRQFLLRGLEKVIGRVVPDLHRPQPAQAVPLRLTGPRMSMGHPANRARWDVHPTGWERRPMPRASQSEHRQPAGIIDADRGSPLRETKPKPR